MPSVMTEMSNMNSKHLRHCAILMAVFASLLTGCKDKAAVAEGDAPKPEAKPSTTATIYVGTYTNSKSQSKGIYKLSFDAESGKVGEPEVAVEAQNPSYLCFSPDKKYVYSCIESPEGGVASFSVEADGTLKKISDAESGGKVPCFISVDATGRNVLCANYTGGNISRFVSDSETARLQGPMAVIDFEPRQNEGGKQDKPHAHCIMPDTANSFVLATDLGTDKVMIYRLDPLKGLVPTDSPSATLKTGSGPRHFTFSKDGKFVYVINEYGNSVVVFSYDNVEGTLKEVQVVPTLPADYNAKSFCAHVLVHPSGKFLYGSNRGHDSIAAFKIDEATGKLELIGHTPTGGKWPRNFNIDPSGKFLIAANQNTDNLVVFKIDTETGGLTPTGQTVAIPAPVCVQFLVR